MSAALDSTVIIAAKESSMSAPLPPKFPNTLVPCIFLDPEKTPREIRDLIYDQVIKDEYSIGRSWMHPAFKPWKVSIRSRGGPSSSREPTCLPALAAACKQIQTEFVDRVYRTTTLEIKANACLEQPDLAFTATDSLIHLGQMRRLDLRLRIGECTSYKLTSKPKNFLKEPFSICYNKSDGRLSEAKLVRSETRLAPTPYFDLKKDGFYSDGQLQELLEAELCPQFPTGLNSDFGKQLTNLFCYLRVHRNLKTLNVQVDVSPGNWDLPWFPDDSGISGFLRLFYCLHRLEKVTIHCYDGGDNGWNDSSLQSFNKQAKEVENWLKSGHECCNDDVSMVYNCETCFPPLGSGNHQAHNAEVDLDDEASDAQVKLWILDIEQAKEHFQAAEDAFEDQQDAEPWMRDEQANGYEGFYVGLADTPHRNQYKEVWEEFGEIWRHSEDRLESDLF